MTSRKGLTVEEINEILEDENFWVDEDRPNVDITVLPPDPDYVTDEDEADDDQLGIAEVRDVPGLLEVDEDHRTQNEENSIAEENEQKSKKQKLSRTEACWEKKEPIYNFSRENFAEVDCKKVENLKEQLGSLTPLQIFEKILPESILEHIRDETIRYARCTKNDQDFSLDVAELKVFIGILLFSGYHQVPSERMYWSRDDDLGVEIIRNAMARNRYIKIKAMLHFANNDKLDKTDRLFKIRPLVNKINESFQQFGTFTSHISIDEMIVKYFGHHGLKQFIRGKPIRFGYKLWALCSSSGYCFKFIVYTGKETQQQVGMNLGSKVVTELLSCVPVPNEHVVFFDNFFTSRDLLAHLTSIGFRATGTVRENRTDRCPLKDSKDMNKEKRGSFDYQFDKNAKVLMVRWKDNKCVIVASNYDSVRPLANVSRWSRESKQRVEVPQPKLIQSYNKHMGGVDQHDWLIGKYGIQVRGKKWYWPLFTRMVDMALTNAWILYRTIHGNAALNCLEFRRAIVVPYLKISAKPSKRQHTVTTPMVDVKYDGINHLIQYRSKQRRCQRRGCKSKPTSFCPKCDVTLCSTCFLPYHTK